MALFKIPSDTNDLLVHTDILRGMKFPLTDKTKFLNSHEEFISTLIGSGNIYYPAFNYDCLKTGLFNVNKDPIQVGLLNEYLRVEKKFKRNLFPVFSFISKSNFDYEKFQGGSVVDPFGQESLFHSLYLNNAYLIHYGSPLSSSTIIHYVERISDRLFYRYDKYFDLKIILENESIDVSLKYHVRPMGLSLEYDWYRLEKDLLENRLLSVYESGRSRILGIKIKELVDFWNYQLSRNPFYLLDHKTQETVEKKLNQLGRGFDLKDFE